jgi:hypothetical protein
VLKFYFAGIVSVRLTLKRGKGKVPETDPDLGGSKTCGSCGFGFLEVLITWF